jgi:hypothetical protein
MPRYALYYDPETDKSPFLDALWRVRHLCTRASATVPYICAPGSHAKVEAIRNAIDNYAECEMGSREFFWDKPHKAG